MVGATGVFGGGGTMTISTFSGGIRTRTDLGGQRRRPRRRHRGWRVGGDFRPSPGASATRHDLRRRGDRCRRRRDWRRAPRTISTFSGGITNSGKIVATLTGIQVNGVTTFLNGISNSGAISAGLAGISVQSVGTFSGGISNSGTIAAGTAGVYVTGVTSFSGDIANSGTISVAGDNDIFISVSTFSGTISNCGTILGGSQAGITVNNTATFSGGVSNSGMISADNVGIRVVGV